RATASAGVPAATPAARLGPEHRHPRRRPPPYLPLPPPVGVEELPARRVDARVEVRAEAVAPRLDQVRRQALGAVAVVERQRGREGGHGPAGGDRPGGRAGPTRLAFGERAREAGGGHQVVERRVLLEGGSDVTQEPRADHAAAPP